MSSQGSYMVKVGQNDDLQSTGSYMVKGKADDLQSNSTYMAIGNEDTIQRVEDSSEEDQ